MNEVLQLLFSCIVTVSTVVYAILTWKLVSETRKMREFQITPNVNIYLERGEVDQSNIYLIFANSGLGVAKNVKFEIIKDFESYDSFYYQIDKKGIIKKGIDNFYPNQKQKFFLLNLSQDFETKIEYKMIIRAKYIDINRKAYSKDFSLSLSELAGIIKLSPPDNYLGKIAYELSEIKKEIKK